VSGRIFQTLVALVLSGLWAIALGYGHWRDELPFLDRAEGALTALRMVARGERPAPELVTIVAIDDDTVARTGAYPLHRADLAAIVDGIARFKPRIIALDVLLFSSLAVVIAYVHQLTIFMIVPIFNSMARIDKRTIEAARDAGASRFEIVRFIVLPLCKTGIALGSIFVVSIVMGDFFVVKVMSGGGSASVVGAFYEDIGVLQYPTAAASATILTIIVLLLVVAILRTVDIRKELTR